MNEARYRKAERRLWASLGVSPTERRLHLSHSGVGVRVQEAGEGPAVVFVHGGSNSGTSWAPLVAQLEDFHCILLDRPGCGLSDPLATNFDNVEQVRHNSFPHHGYVLVATSDLRETYTPDNRRKFIARCTEIAAGRPLIFKLHPNEKLPRAVDEIKQYAPPGTLVYTEGNTDHMIANCAELITQYSTVVYVGLGLGQARAFLLRPGRPETQAAVAEWRYIVAANSCHLPGL